MASLPRVLLIGDSQRARYQPVVARLLEGRVEVVGPTENCATSGFTLSMLPQWLAQLGRPDVVHWNNGLHDAGHNPERAPDQVPLETYLSNLRAILALLRATGARVAWATSTPVHPNRPFDPAKWSWRNEELARYNAAALELMRAERVPVNDFHVLVASNPDLYLAADLLHLSPAAGEACGAAIVRMIEPWLPRKT